MKIKERLLECKVKAKITSDYKLAKELKINRATLHHYMTGKRQPDAYAAVQIGKLLKIHPLMLLAEFEAEGAKTAERKAFWENFAQRIKTEAVEMLALTSTAFWSSEQKAEVGSPEIRIMPQYRRKHASRLTITNRPLLGGFFCPPLKN